MTSIQNLILKQIRSLGIEDTIKGKGDDAVIFCHNGTEIIVRYYPEIESYQIKKRNILTQETESNISVASERLSSQLD